MKKGCLKESFKNFVKGRISYNEILKDHTTFRIGGMPRIWVEPASLTDLRCTLKIFHNVGLRPFVIGNGSNLLIRDGRLKIGVIKLSSPVFKRIKFYKQYVVCGSGCELTRLITKCVQKGLSGLEYLAGIPATVGGAVATNAGLGDDNISIGNCIRWVKIMDYKGEEISLLEKDKLRFWYRGCNISKHIILEVGFLLNREKPKKIKKRFTEVLKKKLATQEFRWPNAGSIFKNPSNFKLTSGQILERCGLKGTNIGDAEISTKHANFIINKGKASFKDVVSLLKIAQKVVKKNHGIWLEPEIEIVR